MSNSPEDLSDVLLRCQKDLEDVRNQIDELPAQSGDHATIYNSLRSILHRAEANLSDKAAFVLKQATYTPLASLKFPRPVSTDRTDSSTSSGHRQELAVSTSLAKQNAELWGPGSSIPNSTVLNGLKRDRKSPFSNRRRQSSLLNKRTKKHRPMMRLTGGKQYGLIRKGHAAAIPKILPKINRKSRNAPLPIISRQDLREGLYNLVNRGAIPKNVELSSLAKEGTLRHGAANLNDYHRRFDPQTVATVQDIANGLDNLHFDLSEEIKLAQEEMKRPPKIVQELKDRIITSTVMIPEEKPPSSLEETKLLERHEDRPENQKQDVRDYDQLLDQYSLHQFIIRKGKVLDTPEFTSFKRKYAHIWGSIASVLKMIEQLLANSRIDMVLCNGTKLVELAEDSELKVPTKQQLMSCLGDMDSKPLKIKNVLSEGENKARRAAVKIQAFARMWLMRKNYRIYKFRYSMASCIQRAWRSYLFLKNTRIRISKKWEKKMLNWRCLMADFRRDWHRTCRKRRVEIHVPSMSLHANQRRSMHNFNILENAQMSRLAVLKDPKVEVIYIAPFRIPREVLGYFYALLEVGGVESPQRRIRIAIPENIKIYPDHFSLSKIALYSPVLLNTVREWIHGRPAYIVPGDTGQEDLQLAVELNVPMLSAEPDMNALLGSKSAARGIFSEAKVPIMHGVGGIYDEKEFFKYFSKLVVENLDVKRWIFKIDHERGGRGIAFIDMMSLQVYRSILKERDSNIEWWNNRQVRSGAEIRIIIALRGEIAQKARFAHPKLYPSWEAYARDFFRDGGVIEACPNNVVSSPSANVFVEPDGTVNITSTHDQVFSRDYVSCGNSFPSSGPHEAIHDAALMIARVAFKHGLIGFLGLDFVLSYDARSGTHSLMAVDLNPRLTDSATNFMLFDCLINGKFFPALGEYRMMQRKAVEKGKDSSRQNSNVGSSEATLGPKRFYTAINYLYQPQISSLQMNTFFNACRLGNIAYDIQSNQGTVFILIDSFASGALGVLSVGRDLLSEVAIETKGQIPGSRIHDSLVDPGIIDSIQLIVDALVFIREQLSSSMRGMKHVFASESNLDPTLLACRALLKRKKWELEATKQNGIQELRAGKIR